MVRIGNLVLDRSIVAVVGKNAAHAATNAMDLGADILEVRIDLLDEDPSRVLRGLRNFGLPVIITNRTKLEGGAWEGNEDERMESLVSLLPLTDAVDIELCARDRDLMVSKAKSAGKKVIISTHDFQNTPEPDVITGIIDESLNAGADIAKLAVMPNSLDDVINLLRATLHAKGPVCTIAMGEMGKHTRVLAPIYGSVMTYGHVGDAVAPGQLRVDELRSLMSLF